MTGSQNTLSCTNKHAFVQDGIPYGSWVEEEVVTEVAVEEVVMVEEVVSICLSHLMDKY